jgi:hypothetical protein
MVLKLNDLTLGDYAERSGDLTFTVSKRSGVSKTSRIPSYTTGVGPRNLKISFATNTLGTVLDSLETLLTSGEGVYYLYDASNDIFQAAHGVWVAVENITYDADRQDHANGIDRGVITLQCVVANDHTNSYYEPPVWEVI